MCNTPQARIPGDGRPLGVLIVEDEQVSGHLLQALLERSPLSISTIAVVERLSDAMHHLNEHDCQLVLLDLNLPDSSGVETLTAMIKVHPHLAFIVITGEYDETLAVEILAHGAQDYLVKGMYSVEGLLKTIRYALARTAAVHAMRTSEK